MQGAELTFASLEVLPAGSPQALAAVHGEELGTSKPGPFVGGAASNLLDLRLSLRVREFPPLNLQF